MRKKVNLKQREEIVIRYFKGETQSSLAREFGVTQPTIVNILKKAREGEIPTRGRGKGLVDAIQSREGRNCGESNPQSLLTDEEFERAFLAYMGGKEARLIVDELPIKYGAFMKRIRRRKKLIDTNKYRLTPKGRVEIEVESKAPTLRKIKKVKQFTLEDFRLKLEAKLPEGSKAIYIEGTNGYIYSTDGTFYNRHGRKVKTVSGYVNLAPRGRVRAAQLIGEQLIANPQEHKIVGHINGNKGDFSLSNLHWYTREAHKGSRKLMRDLSEDARAFRVAAMWQTGRVSYDDISDTFGLTHDESVDLVYDLESIFKVYELEGNLHELILEKYNLLFSEYEVATSLNVTVDVVGYIVDYYAELKEG